VAPVAGVTDYSKPSNLDKFTPVPIAGENGWDGINLFTPYNCDPFPPPKAYAYTVVDPDSLFFFGFADIEL
jgi:hypothetical protein